MNGLNDRPIAIDLFAGAGGLSLGFEQAGFDVAAAVEFDPIHAATHQVNFPNSAVLCRDVRKVTGEEIRAAAGIGRRAVDVVVGGPPCQGFSLIGHRNLGDRRNELVFHFLRLVLELRPRTFMMENVPGMAIRPHTEVLDELVEKFQDAGYRLRLPYRILRATDYGVPQDRRRLFLFGARSDARIPEYPEATTFLPVKANGHLGGLVPCPTVRDAIGDLPDIEEREELFETDELRANLRGGSEYARILRGEVRDPRDHSYPRDGDPRVLTGCLRAKHTAESRRRFAAAAPGTTEPISRFYKLSWTGVCNTLRAGTASDRGAFSAPRPIHPERPRCISVREAARLHSYPDWFRFHRTIWHGFRQIGNSVPPFLARSIGESILAALGANASRPRERRSLGAVELSTFNMREAAAHFGVDPRVIAPRKRVAVTGS